MAKTTKKFNVSTLSISQLKRLVTIRNDKIKLLEKKRKNLELRMDRLNAKIRRIKVGK